MTMIGTQLSRRYRLESKLGSGGMSTVYLAIDETLDREVAIKVMHREISSQADQLERFRREARAVASLSHPNLVGVIDAGEDEGHPYIVFEYVPGETLKKRIDEGRLGIDEAVAYGIEVGRGLAVAHAARLIHRDVKPQNVLIDAEGRAKVTDFGIALSLEAHGLTATGRVLGTTDYVSPEQAMGQEIDDRTDVYSLGILLYEMLTGDLPFQAETQVGVAMKHVNDIVPDVQERRPEVSSALAAVVEKAVAKKPEDRYPNMAQMIGDLEGALEVEVVRAGHSTGEATTVLKSVPPRRRRLVTRRRMSWAGTLLLIAAAGAALALTTLTGDDEPAPEVPAAGEPARQEIPITSVEDFDPDGGDGERSDLVDLATDGNPNGTEWTTETYGSADFSGLGKSGVGLIVETADDVTPKELMVRSTAPGWEVEVFGSNESSAPETLADWGPPLAGPLSVDSTEQLIPLNTSSANRFFLVYVTSLAEVPDDPGDFRVEISDLELLS